MPAIPNIQNLEYGAGRVCQVEGEISLKDAIERIKAYTGLKDMRVAVSVRGSMESKISSFGCCPGSGGSVLKEISSPIDLFITGEMSHHELLDAAAKNISVIMLNHSNSERGYLKHFSGILKGLTKEVEIIVSECDEDPLKTY